MPAPHPLASLYAAGGTYADEARARLRSLLAAHGGDVRATAAALVPPVHETTLHDWLTRWGVREGEARQRPRGGAKKKTSPPKKGLA